MEQTNQTVTLAGDNDVVVQLDDYAQLLVLRDNANEVETVKALVDAMLNMLKVK